MSAHDELMTALLVERYDNRWWRHPSMRDDDAICAQRRRQMDADFREDDGRVVVVEIGREAS